MQAEEGAGGTVEVGAGRQDYVQALSYGGRRQAGSAFAPVGHGSRWSLAGKESNRDVDPLPAPATSTTMACYRGHEDFVAVVAGMPVRIVTAGPPIKGSTMCSGERKSLNPPNRRQRGMSVRGFTERARQVVVLLARRMRARELKHNYIGTEHILLGLLRKREGLDARVSSR